MADYSTLRTRIIDELANDGALTTAQVNYAIADTIKVYERRPFWFNQTTGTFSTVANQENYTSADLTAIPDIVQIIASTLTYNSIKYSLKPLDYLTIDDSQDGSVVTRPEYFAYYAESIRLYPIPDQVYTVTLSYIQRFTALSDDTDENAWTNEAEELIRQGAKRRIALNYFHAEDVAARIAPQEQEALAALMAEDRRRRPNTLLRAPAMLPPQRFNINVG